MQQTAAVTAPVPAGSILRRVAGGLAALRWTSSPTPASHSSARLAALRPPAIVAAAISGQPLRCVLAGALLVAAGSAGTVGHAASDGDASPREAAFATARTRIAKAMERHSRRGWGHSLEPMHALLLDLGETEKRAAAILKRSQRSAERARKRSDNVAGTVAHLEAARAALLPLLADGGDEEVRREAAGLVLRIDGENAAAWKALGRVAHGGEWVPPDMVPFLKRREQLEGLLLVARSLEIEIDVEPSEHYLFKDVYGEGGTCVRSGELEIHVHKTPVEKAKRILRETLRALAVGNRLITDVVGTDDPIVPILPSLLPENQLVLMDSTPDYVKAIDALVERGRLSSKDHARAVELNSHWIPPGRRIVRPMPEAHIESVMFDDLWVWLARRKTGGKDPQKSLRAGLVNWICNGYLGTPIPSYAWVERKGESGKTFDHVPRVEEFLRLADAGLRGARMWMEFLAEREEDPAWSGTFQDQMGKIAGDALTKATFVALYLVEKGDYVSLLHATAGRKPTAEVFRDAIECEFTEFESAWREWLLAGETRIGLLQSLRGVPGEGPADPEHAKILSYLDELRVRCVNSEWRDKVLPLRMDDELSKGCQAHAEYLAKNPDQAKAWPDAHEEWPDREGFSPAGSRAGLASVIAPGSTDGKDAIDGWLATFYHRLPLIHPGLVRIGWGIDEGFAVLDSGSMVGRFPGRTLVRFPQADATGVPHTFAPELPHPVPGEDQSTWGYPVTLQTVGFRGEADIGMKLHEGSASGPEVPCHYSTPMEPTNPELAPSSAYCLIPKVHLKLNTLYTVVCTGIDDWPDESWSFTTR